MLLRKRAIKYFLAFASTTLHHIHFLLASIFTFTSWLRMQSSIWLSRFYLTGRFLTTYGNTILLCSRLLTNVSHFFYIYPGPWVPFLFSVMLVVISFAFQWLYFFTLASTVWATRELWGQATTRKRNCCISNMGSTWGTKWKNKRYKYVRKCF